MQKTVQEKLLAVKNLPIEINLVPDYSSRLILEYNPVPLNDCSGGKIIFLNRINTK